MSRALSFLCCLCLLALPLSGCFGQTESAPSAVTPETSGQLTLLVGGTLTYEQLEPLAEAFNRTYPLIEVKLVTPPQDLRAWQGGRLNPALAGKVDIVLLPLHYLAHGPARAGELKDLSSLPVPPLDPAVAHLFDDLSRVDGKRYSFPLSIMTGTFWVNDHTLERYGLAVPPADWTLAEFEAAMRTLKEKGRPRPYLPILVDPLVRSFGGRIYDPGTGHLDFDSAEVRQGLAWIARMVQEDLLAVEIYTGREMDKAFRSLLYTAYPPTRGEYVHPFPRGPRGRATPVSAIVAVVPAAAPQPELAAQFLTEALRSPEMQLAFARTGVRPLGDNPEALAAWREAAGPRHVEAFELSLQGAYPVTSGKMSNAAKALIPYFTGESTLDEVLRDLRPQLEEAS